ncbi:hypothetical protein [Rhodanobacter sp. L36]|uniref:hypothetical protein n=1 Tax=Rhodanobacter sp. L36 TaxID=1747221 RepID=UPI00131CD603|nr:hypothetical protein [Rhodanobacter sp. L36]
MKRLIHVFLIMLALGIVSTAVDAVGAVAKQPKPTGMFSDMAYNDEGGDLLGTEIFVTYARDGYFVVYQSSEGEPTTPAVMPATISGTSIKFAVPKTSDPRGNFVGTIGSKELTGSFSGSKEIIHLKRKASYWQ